MCRQADHNAAVEQLLTAEVGLQESLQQAACALTAVVDKIRKGEHDTCQDPSCCVLHGTSGQHNLTGHRSSVTTAAVTSLTWLMAVVLSDVQYLVACTRGALP